jgi:hypothetical protein
MFDAKDCLVESKKPLDLKDLGTMLWSIERYIGLDAPKFIIELWNVETKISFNVPKFNNNPSITWC